MPSMSRDCFLREYDLRLDKEWECDGRKAEWASDGPRLWGDEDASLALPNDDPVKGNVPTAAAALSPDNRLLAVSTNAIIRIYAAASREQLSELVGHVSNVQKLLFAPAATRAAASQPRAYLLLSSGAEVGGADGDVIAWHLDAQGRRADGARTMPFAIHHLADKAMDAIAGDLVFHHNLARESMQPIRDALVGALVEADTKNRARDVPKIAGHVPTFQPNPISHDGSAALIIVHGETTQHGKRSPNTRPQISVSDLDTSQERCRLKGHQDAIMWAAWAPDDQLIATACWDGTYKFWDATSGDCLRTIKPNDRQQWSGAFSPDGKRVMLSGTDNTAIYDVMTGEKLLDLRAAEGGVEIASWVRYFAWHPHDQGIAILNGAGVLLWEPHKGNKVQEVFRLGGDSVLNDVVAMVSIRWVDDGRKLLVSCREKSVFVWDRARAVKWRFQRPKGPPLAYSASSMMYLPAQNTVLTLNGDRKVRYWKLEN